jgi:hypothetical protein
MIAPAAIYLLLAGGSEVARRGWGIPMATDIAFAVGILALLGSRVPIGLKIFLLALAIADDIGAIVVIALFYSGAIHLAALGLAALGLILIFGMHRLGVRSIVAYWIAGAGVWLAMHYSGIHPTIAGVALGLMTPGRAWVAGESLVELMLDAVDRLDGEIERPHGRSRLVGELATTAKETLSPLERLEVALHPWVAFVIMPIFALANAGVLLRPAAATTASAGPSPRAPPRQAAGHRSLPGWRSVGRAAAAGELAVSVGAPAGRSGSCRASPPAPTRRPRSASSPAPRSTRRWAGFLIASLPLLVGTPRRGRTAVVAGTRRSQ